MSEALVIRPGISTVDRCPIMTRVRAFLCQQGVRSTLEYQFTNREGRPLDLDAVLPGVDGTLSVSESDTQSVSPTGDIVARIRQAGVTGQPNSKEPIYVVGCSPYESATGKVRLTLTDNLVQRAGLYEMFFAIRDADEKPLLINRALLSIEHTLFADQPYSSDGQLTNGPPTIQEIRMYMRDSHRYENLLLDDVEFGDEEIVQAILAPINMWNDALPPMKLKMKTTTFPYREQWKLAIAGYLFLSASHRYRRNALAYSAGGTGIDDQNKEREYAAAGEKLLQEYKAWVNDAKMSLNMQGVTSHFGSPYSW